MNRFISFLIVTLYILTFSTILYAEKNKIAYVSDVLILTVREGPSRTSKVFKTIESNERVEILREKDSFSEVKLKNGITGWVKTQYLTFKTPDPVIIRILNRKIEKLNIRNNQLKEQITKLKGNLDEKLSRLTLEKNKTTDVLNQITTQLNDYKNKYVTVNKKYNDLLEQSNNVVLISKENEKLKAVNKECIEKIDSLELKNRSILKIGMIKWFLSGAGVIFLGWIIGRTVSPRSSRRSRLLG